MNTEISTELLAEVVELSRRIDDERDRSVGLARRPVSS